MESVQLTQVITESTRVSSHSTLIDHVYVSNSDSIIHKCVPVYAASDHYPICITQKNVKQKNKRKQISYRWMKNFDENAFMSEMCNAPWHLVNKEPSPDEALATWSKIFQNTIDKHMPVIQKKVKHSSQPKWMNIEIRKDMHTRDLHKKK